MKQLLLELEEIQRFLFSLFLAAVIPFFIFSGCLGSLDALPSSFAGSFVRTEAKVRSPFKVVY